MATTLPSLLAEVEINEEIGRSIGSTSSHSSISSTRLRSDSESISRTGPTPLLIGVQGGSSEEYNGEVDDNRRHQSSSLNSFSDSSSSSSHTTPAPLHPQLLRICLYLFLHASTLGILAICIPNLLLRLHNDNTSDAAYTASLGSSITAGLGFIIYPILGMLSDYYGRKSFICLTLTGSTTAFLLLGCWNTSVIAFFLAATIRGITDVSYTLSYAVLGDVTLKKDFIQNYGKLQACSGVGLVIGPVLAIIAEAIEKERAGFFLAAMIETVNLVYIVRVYQETLFHFDRIRVLRREGITPVEEEGRGGIVAAIIPSSSSSSLPPSGLAPDQLHNPSLPSPTPLSFRVESFSSMYARRTLNPFKSLKILFQNGKRLRYLSLALFFHFIGFTGMISVFFLYTHERFGWGSTQNGGFILTLGVISIISNALVLPKLLHKYRVSESRLLTVSMFSSLVSNLIWAFIPTSLAYGLFLVAAIFMCSFFLVSLIRALISREIIPNKQGELQGGLTCLISLASLIGPLSLNSLFGYFISKRSAIYAPGAPFMLTFVLNCLTATLLWYVVRYLPHVRSDGDDATTRNASENAQAPEGYVRSPQHDENEMQSYPQTIEMREMPQRKSTRAMAASEFVDPEDVRYDDHHEPSSTTAAASSYHPPIPHTSSSSSSSRSPPPSNPHIQRAVQNRQQDDAYGQLVDEEIVR